MSKVGKWESGKLWKVKSYVTYRDRDRWGQVIDLPKESKPRPPVVIARFHQRASPRPLWCRLLVVWIPKEGASLRLVFCRGGLFRFALSQQSLIWSFSPKSINNAFFVVMGILQIDVTGDNPLPHISNNLSLQLSKLLSLRGCPLSKDIVERVHLIMKNSHRSGSIGFTLRPLWPYCDKM